jgi:adenine-specific DNA-methyltransferase
MSVQLALNNLFYHEPRWLLQQLELFRLEAARKLDPARKAEQGQFFTPLPLAKLMASLFKLANISSVSILDAGAGVGTLFATLVVELTSRPSPPRQISVTTFETDPLLWPYLEQTS